MAKKRVYTGRYESTLSFGDDNEDRFVTSNQHSYGKTAAGSTSSPGPARAKLLEQEPETTATAVSQNAMKFNNRSAAAPWDCSSDTDSGKTAKEKPHTSRIFNRRSADRAAKNDNSNASYNIINNMDTSGVDESRPNSSRGYFRRSIGKLHQDTSTYDIITNQEKE